MWASWSWPCSKLFFGFFFSRRALTEFYTLSLHDALPIFGALDRLIAFFLETKRDGRRSGTFRDRKSTRLNSSHVSTSYAVPSLKKKKRTRSRRGIPSATCYSTYRRRPRIPPHQARATASQ